MTAKRISFHCLENMFWCIMVYTIHPVHGFCVALTSPSTHVLHIDMLNG